MTPAPAPLPYEAALASPKARAKEALRRLLAATAAPLGTLVRVATSAPAIALTFDDGPDPVETPPLLDLLGHHGAHATFFQVGVRAAAQRPLVERMIASGHAVANHSWDHPSFPRLSRQQREEQLRRCDAALAPLGTSLFRPPFGEQSLASLRDARRGGYRVVAWDVVAEDWRDDAAQVLLSRVLRRLRRGSIVIFHDTLYRTEEERFRDRRPMRAAVGELLARLAPTYRFVTIPHLLRLGRPVWSHHYHRLPEDFHRQLR